MPSPTSAFLAALLRGTLAALALSLALPAAAEPVRLGGTGAAIGTMALLAQAYRKLDPAFQLELVPNLGSGGGIKAVQGGAIQIAAIARGLKPEETAAGLRATEYGRTAFVLATGKAGVQGLSLAQIADLYAARRTRWDDGQPVRLVLRPASDGDSALLAAMSPQIKDALAHAQAREGMVTGMTDQDSADAIERLPGGLGTSSLALLMSERRQAKALAIEGIAPTVENLANGRYPYVKSLYLVTPEAASPGAKAFLAFIASEAGRRILAETGHIAAPAAAAAR